MGIIETIVVYTLIGIAVATSLVLAQQTALTLTRIGLFAVHTLCWPFFAPILLGGALEGGDHRSGPAGDQRMSTVHDTIDPRIRQVESKLMSALNRAGGIAEELLGPEMSSVRNLSESLARMDARITEMDALLDSPEFDRQRAQNALAALLDDPAIEDGDERITSVRSRIRNIERLHRMRRLARRDLQRALLKMEEMNSQLLLLQFADQPEDEIAQNIQDIASTIDGLSEGLLGNCYA